MHGVAPPVDRTDADTMERLADRLEGGSALALTGAGVSAPSGVPTFRGEDGIWGGAFDPADFHASRLASDPAGFWADRIELRETMRPPDLAPNAAHEALADMEERGVLEAVITQNTDGLHGAAGSARVIELHGSAARVACEGCGRRSSAAPAFERARDGELPPRCDCDGVLRPDVVLFGEELPRERLQRTRRLARECDVLLAVGSSLSVQPAASLPATAARDGAVWVVNLEATPYDDRADGVVRGDVTQVLPELVELLRDRSA